MPLEASLRPRAPAHAFISRTSVAIRSSIYGQIRGFSSDQTSSSGADATRKEHRCLLCAVAAMLAVAPSSEEGMVGG